VCIDRTAKFAVAQLFATADRKTAWEFLQHLLEAVPYWVHTIRCADRGHAFLMVDGRLDLISCLVLGGDDVRV
jgi:hypothetical protein